VTKVLVVDDESNLVDLVEGYLNHEGFDVIVARHGPTAVESARALAPDLIILDVMLPGFDGLEVCRRVWQFSDAYILMLTARTEELDRIVGLEVGADDYLTKPFSPRELIARVKAMLRRPRSSVSTPSDAPAPAVFVYLRGYGRGPSLGYRCSSRKMSSARVPVLERNAFNGTVVGPSTEG